MAVVCSVAWNTCGVPAGSLTHCPRDMLKTTSVPSTDREAMTPCP